MTNSIRENLDKGDIISEISLTIDYPYGKDIKCVVVEGIDDIRTLRKFFLSDVLLYESFSGKDGLFEIVDHFNDVRVIGIYDKDYEKNNQNGGNKFPYDYCNLEMMILSFDEVIDNLLCESKIYSIESSSEFRNKILDMLRPISLIRRYNYINSGSLKLDSLISNDIINYNRINNDKLIVKINERNIGKDTSCLLSVINDCYEENLLTITNGHDATNLISHYLKVNHNNIQIGMRCSFNFNLFKKTLLYSKIIEYENKNQIRFLVSHV